MNWRRLLTVPGFVIVWALWIAATPFWLVASVVLDAVRKNRGVAFRCSSFLAVYLTCEVLGIAASVGLWIWGKVYRLDDRSWTDLHFRLEAWWGATLFWSVVRLFELRLEIEGENEADLGHGPYLLLPRHTSSGDTLLASAIVSRPYGIRLRYVLKQENLWDPCLDIVGNRVPNVFVDRFSNDSRAEIVAVQAIAHDLGPHDGVLMYPEGTRFSADKRNRVIERLRAKRDEGLLEQAESLQFVLPPRLGGTLGILDAAPEIDVVFCSHTGFEGAASLAEIWNGTLVGQVIRVRFRRIPRAEIPRDRAGQIDWLLEEWRRVDAWVGANRGMSSSRMDARKISSNSDRFPS